MNATVGGPQAQVVMTPNGRSIRAKMTRVGTVLTNMIVMRAADGREFIVRVDHRGVLEELTIYEVFEELEKYHKLVTEIDAAKEVPYTMPDFVPHLDYKPADEDHVRPNFFEDERTFF